MEDTVGSAAKILIEGYRCMTAAAKLGRVCAMNEAIRALAEIRLRERYGRDLSERELRLRLAALWLDRATMIKVFGWDPEEHGY
jgi:hypothetical protein